MIEQFADLLERHLQIPPEQTMQVLGRIGVALAAASFVLVATMVVAFDDVFTGRSNISSLEIGDIVPSDITAPKPVTYTSQILTQQRREEARENVPPVFDPPDPNVARQRTELARQILDYIDNVRHDTYASREQKIEDINHITALELPENIIQTILDLDEETWRAVDDEIINVLPRVMRESIRETQLQTVRDQLPTQVSVRFNADERAVIVAIVGDLVRPNTFQNPEATETARQAAAEAVTPVERTFARGQIVVSGGDKLETVDYEALQALDLLTSADLRLQEAVRAFLATIVVVVVTGLYILRFKPSLIYNQTQLLTLLAVIFLLMLLGARLVGVNGQIYIFPAAALALIYLAIVGPEVAVIGSLGLALLVGMMAKNSLEIATMITAGSLIGTLTLRHQERLNSYFFAGVLVSVINTAVVAVFNIGAPAVSSDIEIAGAVFASLLNGVLVAAVAIAGLYTITFLFNLPTSMKLVELSQPSQPLLQRLLREAPGTYQHSLQVANLSEQAANAVNANAELSHVAALYHDIGKMDNPAFFAENQQDIGNPHDTLNDPYRSADIIISHVTGGDELARQYRLPYRIRDFIREHHGTTQVYVFYKQAVNRADGDESQVDLEEFTYPGPKPQSRETAIMMLADSCESATRAMKPTTRQEIADLVHKIIEGKRTSGQLDEANLTLNDLKTIERVFVEMLQAVFHPRINYQEAVARKATAEAVKPNKAATPVPPKTDSKPKPPPKSEQPAQEKQTPVPENTRQAAVKNDGESGRKSEGDRPAIILDDNDDTPLPEVPPLPRANEQRVSDENGTGTRTEQTTDDQT